MILFSLQGEIFMERTITYFENPGPENTDELIAKLTEIKNKE